MAETTTAKKNAPDYGEILKQRKVDFKKKAVQDKIYLSIGDSVIGTTGNFITFSGLPKAGKSTFISCVVAAAVTTTFQDIINFKVHKHTGKDRIALFDTEQGHYDFNKMLGRIKWLAQTDNIDKKFDAFLLREDDSHTILRVIDHYIKNNPDVGIIIIDGLLDCIDNMNDEGASKRLIRLLKRWASKNDILIVTVLHLGKKDLSSIGHVGSACDRYAQSVLLVEKTKDGNYQCKPKFLRSAKDFTAIEIYRDRATGNYFEVK